MKVWEGCSDRVKWLLTIAFITVGIYLGFRFLLPLLFPFIIAYFLAWIIRPVTEALYRRFKLPRVLGGTLSLLLLLLIFGTSFCLLVNILIKQAISFVKNIPVYMNLLSDKIDHICQGCDKIFGLQHGTMKVMADENMAQVLNRVKANIMPEMTEHTISFTVAMVGTIGIMLIVFVSAVLIVKEIPDFHKRFEKNDFYQDVYEVSQKLSEAGMAYLRSQLIIMAVVAVTCVLGLTLIKNEYALLLGMGIAIMDALPVLGSGIIFIPWAIIMLVNGKIYTAAILITTYLICQVIREVLEPKLIGNRIGVKPLFTLMSIYIGLKLFSFAGFFLGPIGLIMIITIYNVVSRKKQCHGNGNKVSL